VRRVDIPAKVTGGPAYVQDLRLPGMAHGRVVWPPSYGATLRNVDTAVAVKLPGVLKIVRDGSYLAVVAEREYQAVLAMRALAAAAQWDEKPTLTEQGEIYSYLDRQPAQQVAVRNDTPMIAPQPARTVEARYSRAYQLHGSIGPSCAVGLFADGLLTVWTHSQGVYRLRNALAQLVNLQPDKSVASMSRVRLLWLQWGGRRRRRRGASRDGFAGSSGACPVDARAGA
jgi:CO/xanthine dehydrogenase Mo-binding subunit